MGIRNSRKNIQPAPNHIPDYPEIPDGVVMKTAGNNPETPSPEKKGEKRERVEEVRYRALFDQSPFGVLVIDTEGKLLDFNEAAHRQLGYTREEFVHLRISDLDPVQDQVEIERNIEDVLKKGEAEFEVKHRAKNGEIRDVRVITKALVEGGRTIFHTIWRDITDEKRSGEALRQSEAKFHALFDSATDAIFILDLDGNFIDINRSAYERLGYTKDEMLSMHVSELHSPANAGKVPGNLARVREQGHGVVYSEHVRKDGTLMPVEINARVVDYEGRKAVFSIIRDITEREKAEEAVIESEKKFHALFDNSPLGLAIVDGSRRFLDCNAAFQKMIGYTREELLTMTIPQVSHAGDDLATRSLYKEMVEGKRDSFTAEKRHIRKDGTVFWTNLTGTLIRDEKNSPRYLFGIMEDISQRKQAEESLILFTNLINRSNDAIFVNDPATGRFLMANDKACRDLGYERARLLTLRTLDIETIFPDQAAWDAHVHAVKNKGSMILEGRQKRRDGTVFPVEVNVTYLVVGDRDYMIALSRDISERKRAEQALRESEERLANAQKMAHMGNWEKNLVTGGLFWSAEIYRIYGLDPAQFTPTTEGFLSTMHSDDREPFIKALNAAVNENKFLNMDYRIVRPDGTVRTLHSISEVSYDPEGKPLTHSGTIQDITESKEAEQALRTSEERLAKAQKMAHVGSWEINLATGEFYWSEEVYRIYGVDPARFVPTFDAVRNTMHPDDLEPFLKAVNSDKYGLDMDYRLIRPDGSERTVHAIGELTCDAAGRPLIHRGTIQDITEHKKLEEALRSSRDFIERILNTVDEAFIVIDRDYRIMLANNAYAAQTSIPLQDIIGKRCHEISHQSSMPCFESGEECSVRQCFETGEPASCVHRHANKDGSILYVETKAFPLKDASGAVTSAIEVINNITDKHLLEEQMLRTQKLEAVGLLAGGIAHDFNNLLQGVFGNISMAKMFSGRESKAFAMLEGAESALYQATNLTKQLLTFSKGGEPVKRVIALPSLVDNAVKFSLSGSNVNSRTAADSSLWQVEADEGQINQVIHNVVLNACEAMPDGGTIGIDMHNVSLDEKSGLPLKKGKYVRIDIQDTGTGIAEHHLPKIFDPYFTTKKKGSGLGLATSYSIMTKHGGLITANSRLGTGSTFSLYLPASPEYLPPAEAGAGAILAGKGRILVMDDEEVVRVVAGHMLDSLGYEADFAENGEQAVEKYKAALKSNRPFHAVILDLTIRGGMGGKETIRKIAAMDPSVRAIVSSGYSADDILSHYREHGFKDVLSKPYQIEVLSRVLHDVLTGPAPS